MVYWKFGICFALLAIIQQSKINADDDTASHTNRVDVEDSNSYDPNAAIAYTDSYANYYANWSPELYEKYGLPQNYYQTVGRKPLRKQDAFSQMADLIGTDTAITLGLIGAVLGTIATVGVAVVATQQSDLSNDQDSICTTTKAVGNTALTLTTATDIALTQTNDQSAAIIAKLNAIENAINGYATPDC